MIKSIRLLNWRSHADTFLEFRKGTNLLVGIMGSGKSSVLEAMSFALFGTFPSLERRRLKLDNLIRLNEPKAKIILEFEWDGHTYKIERILERNKRGITSNAEVFKNNNLVESGTTAVTTYIITLTKLDYDLFTRAIYSEQNNIDYFLTIDPRRRKQEMDVLLGLDKFEIARTNLITVVSRVNAKKRMFEERFNDLRLAELEAKEKTHSQELSSFESNIIKIQETYSKQNQNLSDLVLQFNKLKETQKVFLSLEKEVVGLTAQKKSLEIELSQKEFDESAYAQIKSQLPIFLEKHTAIRTSLNSISEEADPISKGLGAVNMLIKTMAENNKKIISLKAELFTLLNGNTLESLSELQKSTHECTVSAASEIQSMQREISEISDLLTKLKPNAATCPLCSSELNDSTISRIKSERELLINNRKEKIAEMTSLLNTKKNESGVLLSKINRAVLLSDRLTSLEKELGNADTINKRKIELENNLEHMAAKRKTLQNTYDDLSSQIDGLKVRLTMFEAILTQKNRLLELTNKLSDTQQKLNGVQFDQISFDALRDKLETSRIGLERISSEKNSIEMRIRSAKEVLALLNSELSQMRNAKQSITALSKLEEELSVYKNALLETQISLRQNLINAINVAMNEIWSLFYPYKNYRALHLSVTEKDYVFELNDGYHWKSLEAIASGGERASAALTLRVALAMVLVPTLSWLVLDEPTHNLDSNAVELLSSALQSKVPEVVNQVFVITHDEAFIGSDFASSYRLTRDKEHNEGTKVELL